MGRIMSTWASYRTWLPGRLWNAIKWGLTSVTFVAALLATGIGMVAIVGRDGSAEVWHRWSDVGQAFGVLTSVFSGLALVALVITFWMQYKEIRAQRVELAVQRRSLMDAQTELFRTAEANLRTLHVGLLKMALDDAALAAVWPPAGPDLTAERNRQYMYANLVIQHAWLTVRVGNHTEAEMLSNLRYLFTSPLIREFWRATADVRNAILVPGTPEYRFAQLADEICGE
jgi:hypothetical protein